MKQMLIIIITLLTLTLPAQAHEITSCGITEIINTEQAIIPENYIAGNPINFRYSFTTLNNTPVQIITNISQAEIGKGEWTVTILIDGTGLYIQEDGAGNFSSEESYLSAGTHDVMMRITSLPYIIPATYVISSVLTSTPCVPVEHTHPSGSTGSTSGGSGGVGVITNECFPNVQFYETRENDLRISTYVSFNFTSDFPVYEISVKGIKNDPDVAVRLEQLLNLSCKLTEKPQGDIYRYINIFSGVKQDGIKIKFKVSNGWLSGGTVSLLRWQDGVWKDLPTSIIGSDQRYTYYEAQSGGFSHFAIVERFKEAAVVAGAEPTPQATVTVTVTAAQVQPMTQITTTISEEEPERQNLIGYVILALGIILLLGAGTVYVLVKRCPK